MGVHLTRLEESMLRKSTYVEVHDDEEEVKEWDKKDKAEYERTRNIRNSPQKP